MCALNGLRCKGLDISPDLLAHGRKPDVMKLGIDFNQFRYPLLRRELRRVGFKKIFDRIERIDASDIKGPLKKARWELARRYLR
jgi:hypothetical protein